MQPGDNLEPPAVNAMREDFSLFGNNCSSEYKNNRIAAAESAAEAAAEAAADLAEAGAVSAAEAYLASLGL